MTTKNNAVLEAIRKSSDWMGGAVVVKTEDGYEAYPGAHMNDISFSGSRDVVFTVANASDILGDDPEKYSDEELLDYINENIANEIE